MGAIQQAFNQALGYAAIAAGPAVAKQKEIAKEKEQRDRTITAKKGIYEQKKKAVEALTKQSPVETKYAMSDDLAVAADELYELEPTPEVLEAKLKYEGMASHYKKRAEEKAIEAAEATAQQKAQKAEQKEIMAQFMSNIPQSYPIKEVIK